MDDARGLAALIVIVLELQIARRLALKSSLTTRRDLVRSAAIMGASLGLMPPIGLLIGAASWSPFVVAFASVVLFVSSFATAYFFLLSGIGRGSNGKSR